MMPHRFSHHLPPEPPRDSEILKRSSSFKLTLYREPDGDLSGSFELEGSFGNFSNEECQDHVPEGLRFVRELITAFTKESEDRLC